jgi:hypothetical protein
MDDKKLDEIIKKGKMVYVFDIDGTMAKPISATKCEPIYEVIDIVNKRYDEGNYIHIYTARNFKGKEKITKKWLKDHGVKYHELHFGKPKAHLIIDDEAVNIETYLKNPEYYDKKFKEYGNHLNDIFGGERNGSKSKQSSKRSDTKRGKES